MIPPSSSQAGGKMTIRVGGLTFDFCVLYVHPSHKYTKPSLVTGLSIRSAILPSPYPFLIYMQIFKGSVQLSKYSMFLEVFFPFYRSQGADPSSSPSPAPPSPSSGPPPPSATGRPYFPCLSSFTCQIFRRLEVRIQERVKNFHLEKGQSSQRWKFLK